jgi:hypothetical protein
MTKAKPQGDLVILLSPISTRSTGPHRENNACTWLSVVTKAMLPMYTVREMAAVRAWASSRPILRGSGDAGKRRCVKQ